MSVNNLLAYLGARAGQLPTAESGRLSRITVSGGDRYVITFNGTGTQEAIWTIPSFPQGYQGGNLSLVVDCAMLTDTTGNITLQGQIEKYTPPASTDLNTTSNFNTAVSTTTTIPGTTGYLFQCTLTLNASLPAINDFVRLKISRDGASDSANGILHVLGASLIETVTTVDLSAYTTCSLPITTATTINKVTITQPTTAATITIANNKTLTVNKTISLTAADDTGVYTLPTGTKTIPSTADKLSVFAATTSAELASVLSDENGTGRVLFSSGPTMDSLTTWTFRNTHINLQDSVPTFTTDIYQDTTTTYINNNAGSISFNTNTNANSNKVVISSTGKVGIGTTITTVRSKLEALSGTANTDADVAGIAGCFVSATATGQGSNVSIESNDAMAINTGGVLGFGGRFASANTAYANWASIKGLKTSGTSGEYGGYLAFFTRTHGSGSGERVRINDVGNVGIGVDPSTTARLYMVQASDITGLRTDCQHATFTGTVHALFASRANTTAYSILLGYSSGGGDLEFNLRGDGTGFCDGSWTGGGADYAEYFEWQDGNPNNEDRVGYSVSLVGNKIKIAEAGEVVIGIISGNPSVVGNNPLKWKYKYLRDDFNREIRDESGDRILNPDFNRNAEKILRDENGKVLVDSEDKPIDNPDYDESLEYQTRESRKEWGAVGLMGQLRMRAGQPTDSKWILLDTISETVEEWLVR